MKLEQHYCAWFRCEFSFVVQQEHPGTLFWQLGSNRRRKRSRGGLSEQHKTDKNQSSGSCGVLSQALVGAFDSFTHDQTLWCLLPEWASHQELSCQEWLWGWNHQLMHGGYIIFFLSVAFFDQEMKNRGRPSIWTSSSLRSWAFLFLNSICGLDVCVGARAVVADVFSHGRGKNTLVGITCIFISRDCKKECTMRLDPHEDGNVITLCLCREPSGYCIQGFNGVCTNLSGMKATWPHHVGPTQK